MIVFRKSIPANITKQLTLTQPLLLGNGTSALPAYSFSAFPSSGMLNNGAGAMQFSVLGTVTAQINASGVVPNAAGATALGQSNVGWKGLYLDYTNSGTIGAVTINKPSGRANIAAAAASVVITNSLVTAATRAFASLAFVDTTAVNIRQVICTASTITISVNAAATANTAVDWFIVNAD